ncbi:putative Arginine--tRNA ligase [Blattamonas nauphoetae]|uniref:arginine--tRNA ligase n=1 Tax=Blattamonas nauphoetae TaxID=2049346 RepID=A0ABQ9YL40_9EUKA|nr:putative Arginine--tRNA ligase [Blattamonas nauphoetae]
MEIFHKEIKDYVQAAMGVDSLLDGRLDKDLEARDFSFALQSLKKKATPDQPVVTLEEYLKRVQDKLVESPHPLIESADLTAGFLNLKLNRAEIFRRGLDMVNKQGLEYGKSDKYKGQRLLIEHTSTNPNSTIHIGNFRNTITGNFIANCNRAVGWTVEEASYINDLGAQIGITFVGFQKVYPIVKPYLKIDLWIGMIYAISNTLQTIQDYGWTLVEAKESILSKTFEEKLLKGITDQKKREEAETVIDVFADLHSRHPVLVDTLVKELNGINIRTSSAEWNLRYERAEPEAVRLYRWMVNLTYSGQQETLDLVGVHHNWFFYESELGWEGSNQQCVGILKETPYYVPETQKNEKGVPEGGYLDLNRFLKDSGLPIGKGGYQKDYPRHYLIRPDGSTLYTFRDVLYSMKKAARADRVYTVVCSEQNLAQEKVQLALRLLAPSVAEKQWHLSYDLVRLVGGRMSGRRGLFVTADEVYMALKESTSEFIRKRNEQKGADARESEEEVENITHQVAVASMKFTLLSCSLHSELTFDVKKATDPDEASAPFLLYNYARFCSLLGKFARLSTTPDSGVTPLCSFDQIDWSQLSDNAEWKLLMKYALALPGIIEQIACPKIPVRPALPNFPVHFLPEFLINFVRDFSSYYKQNRIIIPGDIPKTHARIWLCTIFRTVLGNGLRLMGITPLERM